MPHFFGFKFGFSDTHDSKVTVVGQPPKNDTKEPPQTTKLKKNTPGSSYGSMSDTTHSPLRPK